MMSLHLGGKVGPHPGEWVEIGYYPIEPTAEGKTHGPWPMQVYHWHREGFSLPQGATCLARGDTFENQAYRYGSNAFGLQFHPEVTRLTMHRWAVLGAHRFALKGAQHGSRHLEGQLVHDQQVRDWLGRFLESWLGLEAQNAAQAA
jgi:GMP synthase (glutamine-hydrolysing)